MIEQILSYKTPFFDIVTTIGYALSPALNKILHAALVKIYHLHSHLQPRIGSIGPDKLAYSVFFMFLCEHSWDPPGANFVIFQRCHDLTLVDLQLDAQNSYLFTYNTFIKILYMFRALPCLSSGGLRRNCIYAASGIVTVCR